MNGGYALVRLLTSAATIGANESRRYELGEDESGLGTGTANRAKIGELNGGNALP